MELSRFLRPSILKFDDWFINVSIGGTGGEDSNIQKDVYFSGKNAYLYASTGSGVTELHIFGNSVQDGTPSIENPVPIISVGENYLQLYSLDINDPSKSEQIIDFGNIKLRSLPNGVCDEIVYKNGQWTHIQRIASIVIDKNTTIQDQLATSNRVTIQINYTLITKSSSNNTNICSKISNSASSVPRFHNYPSTIYVVWDSNKPATFEEAKNMLMGTEFLCELATPVETILDLPKLQTLNGTTYLLTNDQQVKPYLQGYYDVDTTVSGKKIEYIQNGLIGWWQSFGLTNADKPTVIPDKLGNYDLTIRNLNYTNESGFHPTYLQFDGIDDNANVEIERYIGFIQAVVSDLTDTGNQRLSLLSNWADSGSINIIFNRNKLNISNQVADSAKGYIDGEEVTSYNIVNGDGSIHTLAISNSKDGYNLHNIGISSAFNSASNYFVKERFYEAIAYDRVLTEEEIQNNFLVSQIRNGINIPDDIDPIDIIAERTYASGKKFPVYNTYRDRDNDNIESFKILGYTVQEGTPTPEAPIPLLSVGDEGMKLCISDSETGIALQTIDFGNIVLRSLPDGTCDSIEWDGKNWRHVQRVGYVKITPDDIVSVSKIDASHTNYYVQILGVNKGIISNDFKYFRANTKYVNHYMCNKFTYAPTADILNTWYLVENSSILSGWVITDKPTKEEFLELIGDGFEFIGELAEPVETILEGIPAPQTFDNETWFGTPSALVKPYMMCECKVKKALKYQGEIIGQYYFGGNKSNETDRQITDISGNGNDLTPHNFAWTRESGWNQGGIYGDGIDDFITVTKSIDIKDVLISTSDMSRVVANGIKYILSAYIYQTGNLIGLVINNYDHILSVNNNTATATPNNVLAVLMNHFRLKFISEGLTRNINLFNVHGSSGGDNKAKGMIHECLLFSSELTNKEFTNNIQLSKQRNGVDGDINTSNENQLTDINGYELTDSEGNYLTVP